MWLAENHTQPTGIWLRIFKKGSNALTVTYAEALDEALCYGWIDGQKNKYDEHSWLQKFTPRRKKSINFGIVALVPMYFLKDYVGQDFPPPLTHAEFFYGFTGVVLAWQIVFLIISRDPLKYRSLMLPAILEKAAWGVPVLIFYFWFGFLKIISASPAERRLVSFKILV